MVPVPILRLRRSPLLDAVARAGLRRVYAKELRKAERELEAGLGRRQGVIAKFLIREQLRKAKLDERIRERKRSPRSSRNEKRRKAGVENPRGQTSDGASVCGSQDRRNFGQLQPHDPHDSDADLEIPELDLDSIFDVLGKDVSFDGVCDVVASSSGVWSCSGEQVERSSGVGSFIGEDAGSRSSERVEPFQLESDDDDDCVIVDSSNSSDSDVIVCSPSSGSEIVVDDDDDDDDDDDVVLYGTDDDPFEDSDEDDTPIPKIMAKLFRNVLADIEEESGEDEEVEEHEDNEEDQDRASHFGQVDVGPPHTLVANVEQSGYQPAQDEGVQDKLAGSEDPAGHAKKHDEALENQKSTKLQRKDECNDATHGGAKRPKSDGGTANESTLKRKSGRFWKSKRGAFRTTKSKTKASQTKNRIEMMHKRIEQKLRLKNAKTSHQ